MKILLIKLRALGDSVLLSSALASLQKLYPRAEISLLLPEKWASLYAYDPRVAQLFARSAHNSWRQDFQLMRQLAAENFDVSVALHASLRSTLFSIVSGAPERVHHFHGFKDRNLFSTRLIPGKSEVKPILERDLDAVRALSPHPLQVERPQIILTEAEVGQAREFLAAQNLKGPLLCLGLGASRPTKVWPMESYAEVAQNWQRERGGPVLAFYSESERASAAVLPTSVVSCVDFPLRQIAALLKIATLFIGNDSGPKHLAAAVGTRTLSIFGPEDPYEWHPYPNDEHPYLFLPDLECRTEVSPNGRRWCGLAQCTIEKHRCMTGISPAQAWDYVRALSSQN